MWVKIKRKGLLQESIWCKNLQEFYKWAEKRKIASPRDLALWKEGKKGIHSSYLMLS